MIKQVLKTFSEILKPQELTAVKITDSQIGSAHELTRNKTEVSWWEDYIYHHFDEIPKKSAKIFLRRFSHECRGRWEYICEMMDKDVFDFSNSVILDVGNGPCGILNFIPVKTKIGIDPNNTDYLKHDILHNVQKDIVFVSSHAEKMPFLDNTYDIITCINMLDHTSDPIAIIKEIKRVLKPSGIFFLSVDCRKQNETTVLHPHAVTEKFILDLVRPMHCIAKNVNEPCYDCHPSNKRFDGWFIK